MSVLSRKWWKVNEWQIVRMKTQKLINWCVLDEVNQDENEDMRVIEDEDDGMKLVWFKNEPNVGGWANVITGE